MDTNDIRVHNDKLIYEEPKYVQYIHDNNISNLVECINNNNNLIEEIIMVAAVCGKVNIVKYLIDAYKFNVNNQDINGRTILSVSHTLELIRYLVEEQQSDVNLLDKNGFSALYWIGINNNDDINIVEYLLNHGSKVSNKINHGYDILECLIYNIDNDPSNEFNKNAFILITKAYDDETNK